MGNILLLEDDKSLNRGISFKLKKEGYNVCTAFNIKEAKDVFENNKVDLIISDVGLPDGSGFDFCEEIRKISNVHIIMLTALDQEIDIVAGYDIGADDYITKPFNPLELIARVNSQIRRYTHLGSIADKQQEGNTYWSGELVINDDTKQVTVDGKDVKLTPTEYNILKFLTKNKGIVYSIEQIYQNVWEDECYGAENIIAVHIRHIREKIEINPREPKYLKVIWGIGYKIENLEK